MRSCLLVCSNHSIKHHDYLIGSSGDVDRAQNDLIKMSIEKKLALRCQNVFEVFISIFLDRVHSLWSYLVQLFGYFDDLMLNVAEYRS